MRLVEDTVSRLLRSRGVPASIVEFARKLSNVIFVVSMPALLHMREDVQGSELVVIAHEVLRASRVLYSTFSLVDRSPSVDVDVSLSVTPGVMARLLPGFKERFDTLLRYMELPESPEYWLITTCNLVEDKCDTLFSIVGSEMLLKLPTGDKLLEYHLVGHTVLEVAIGIPEASRPDAVEALLERLIEEEVTDTSVKISVRAATDPRQKLYANVGVHTGPSRGGLKHEAQAYILYDDGRGVHSAAANVGVECEPGVCKMRVVAWEGDKTSEVSICAWGGGSEECDLRCILP